MRSGKLPERHTVSKGLGLKDSSCLLGAYRFYRQALSAANIINAERSYQSIGG